MPTIVGEIKRYYRDRTWVVHVPRDLLERALVERLMRCLSERDREVMRLRFAEDLTPDEIGSRLDLSQMQVSRVLRSSMARLQTVAASVI